MLTLILKTIIALVVEANSCACHMSWLQRLTLSILLSTIVAAIVTNCEYAARMLKEDENEPDAEMDRIRKEYIATQIKYESIKSQL